MTQLEFDNLNWLHLLWVAGLVGLAGVYGAWQRRRSLESFAGAALLPRLAPPLRLGRALARLGLVTVALLSLVAAIIGPRWGVREQLYVSRGIDVLVLLDVSRSMLARDIAPNRLERAKLSIRDDLLAELGGDRIGLIAFAGVPSLKCPLTHDYGFFRLALEDVGTESSPRGGTLIGDAIRKAAEAFNDQLDSHKVVLLITDGEDHESYPVEAAQALWEKQKIPVVAVALGDDREGARVPVTEGDYLKHQGQTVWSRANFPILQKVAAISPLNAFIPVGTRNFNLGEIYRKVVVPAIQHSERMEKTTIPLPSRYHGFAVLALLALLVDSFLSDGPRRQGLMLPPESGATPRSANASEAA